MIMQIKIPIITIAFVPVPIQTMISGPKAILGRLFNTIKYGSKTRLAEGIKNNMIAIIVPMFSLYGEIL